MLLAASLPDGAPVLAGFPGRGSAGGAAEVSASASRCSSRPARGRIAHRSPHAFGGSLADRFPCSPGQRALRGGPRGDAEARVGGGRGHGAGHRHRRAGRRRCTGRWTFAASSTGRQDIAAALRQRRHLSAQHARIDDAVLAKLDGLLAEPEVIACGEIGLDYYHEGAPHAVQREGLIRQLEIAAARKRPILIHCRPKDDVAEAEQTPGTICSRFWRSTGRRPASAASCTASAAAGSRRGDRWTWVF